MCGIAGYTNLKNTHRPIDKNLLQNMHKTLSHRGPDGSGIWKSDKYQIGFAHARLKIIDLSDAGRQPMSNRDESVIVCFNGEIYNFVELRKELVALEHNFGSQSDTEILVHGYEEWGINLLEKLDGMFAIAIFDVKKEELFLVRDRIGIKPIYFSLQNGFLSFASEIKALWQLPFNKKTMSERAFYHYLTFMVTPAPYTIFKDVYKLPAGFYAKLDRDKNISFCEWYSPIKNITEQEQKNFYDENFCIENIRNLLRRSTKKRMISDVPFGAFLSGGIDSSLNVALMAQEIGKVKTFTVAFSDGPESNELKWARMISKKFDTDHHEIIISQKEALNFFNKMVYHLDEPLADCVCIPFYHVAKLAKDSGVTVVQVGEGSDELFFGYNVYAQYHKLYNCFYKQMCYAPIFAKKFMFHAAQKFLSRKPNLVDTFYKLSKKQNLFWGGAIAFDENQKKDFYDQNDLMKQENSNPDPIVQKIYHGLNPSADGLQKRGTASRGGTTPHEHDSHTIVDYHMKELVKKSSNTSFMQKLSYLELKQRLPELLLMRADKMSMATGVEARVPFLDHKIVEFALHIPDSIKFKNNTTKYILKKACEGIIPDEIIYRKKVGFAAPIVRWYKNNIFKNNFIIDSGNKNSYNNAVQKWVLQNYEACSQIFK